MSKEKLIDFLSQQSLFQSITTPDLEKISSLAYPQDFQQGEILFLENEPGNCLYLIRRGWVKIAKISSEGREKALAILGSGDCLGELALLDGKGRSAMAQALTPVETFCINSDDFKRLLDHYPRISRALIPVLTARIRRANKEIENLIFYDVQTRMFSFFLEHGKLINNEIVVPRLPHREIASILGTSRETVTRFLGELTQKGAIELKQKQLILKEEAIRQISKKDLFL